jgi:hypothetical protein
MRNRKQKKKKEKHSPPLGWAVFAPSHSPSPSHGQSGTTASARAAPNSPAPPVSCTLSLPLAPLSRWQPGPTRQDPHPAYAFTGVFAADHRPPRRLAINARTLSIGAMRPLTVPEPSPHRPSFPSRPVAFAPSLPSWRARRRSPPPLPSPSLATYKRTAPSPLFHHTRPHPLHLPPSSSIGLGTIVSPLSGEL